MSLELKLAGWTAPSSDAEQERQHRTERMVREAIDAHTPFASCRLRVYAKGSYANNTNVRADSDVDIAVECTEAEYWDEQSAGQRGPVSAYTGVWTPATLRAELVAALTARFPSQVSTSGTTAIMVHSGSARVDADVVPCFSYRYFMANSSRSGTKIYKTDGGSLINYPAQQLEYGRAKNIRTGYAYKKAARMLKRAENAMAADDAFRELPSYFMECLTYNCPDAVFAEATWTLTLRSMLVHIWQALQGDEPYGDQGRFREAHECEYLFRPGQKWTRVDGRDFAKAAWNYFGLK